MWLQTFYLAYERQDDLMINNENYKHSTLVTYEYQTEIKQWNY